MKEWLRHPGIPMAVVVSLLSMYLLVGAPGWGYSAPPPIGAAAPAATDRQRVDAVSGGATALVDTQEVRDPETQDPLEERFGPPLKFDGTWITKPSDDPAFAAFGESELTFVVDGLAAIASDRGVDATNVGGQVVGQYTSVEPIRDPCTGRMTADAMDDHYIRGELRTNRWGCIDRSRYILFSTDEGPRMIWSSPDGRFNWETPIVLGDS